MSLAKPATFDFAFQPIWRNSMLNAIFDPRKKAAG
jgi:hypothetical protein